MNEDILNTCSQSTESRNNSNVKIEEIFKAGGAPARPQKIPPPPCGINLNAAHKIPHPPAAVQGGENFMKIFYAGGNFLKGFEAPPLPTQKIPPAEKILQGFKGLWEGWGTPTILLIEKKTRRGENEEYLISHYQ